MARPRDNKRQRVYDAEEAAAFTSGWTTVLQTIPTHELQGWVDQVMRRQAIRSRWPYRRPVVKLTHSGAVSERHCDEVRLGVDQRNEWIILHEVAHLFTPNTVADHGPEFCGTYLFLLQTVLGKDAANALRTELRKRRVSWSNRTIPASRKVPTLAQMAARRRAPVRQVTSIDAKDAARTIRSAVAAGVFGPAGRKPRAHALATARALEAYRLEAAADRKKETA